MTGKPTCLNRLTVDGDFELLTMLVTLVDLNFLVFIWQSIKQLESAQVTRHSVSRAVNYSDG